MKSTTFHPVTQLVTLGVSSDSSLSSSLHIQVSCLCLWVIYDKNPLSLNGLFASSTSTSHAGIFGSFLSWLQIPQPQLLFIALHTFLPPDPTSHFPQCSCWDSHLHSLRSSGPFLLVCPCPGRPPSMCLLSKAWLSFYAHLYLFVSHVGVRTKDLWLVAYIIMIQLCTVVIEKSGIKSHSSHSGLWILGNL